MSSGVPEYCPECGRVMENGYDGWGFDPLVCYDDSNCAVYRSGRAEGRRETYRDVAARYRAVQRDYNAKAEKRDRPIGEILRDEREAERAKANAEFWDGVAEDLGK